MSGGAYVTVSDPDGSPWVGVSERASSSAAWGEVVRMEGTGDGDAFDAVAMTGVAEQNRLCHDP